jgi:MFS family permease
VAGTFGRFPTGAVIAIAVAAGLLAPALTGGWTAQLGDAVPPAQLRRAQSLDAATYNAGGLTGPGLAAVIVGGFGAVWAVAGTIVMLLAAIPFAATLPAPDRRRLDTSVPAALKAGADAIVSLPALRRMTLASVTAFVGFGMFIVAAPLLGTEHFGSAARGASLLSVLAVGALLSTVATARWPLPMGPDRTFVAATVVAGVTLAVMAAAPNGAVVVAASLLMGIADGPQLAAVIAVRHREAPERLRAQVFTTGASLKVSAGAMGAALAGVLASHSIGLVLAVAAGTQLLALAGYAAVRVRAGPPRQDRRFGKKSAV